MVSVFSFSELQTSDPLDSERFHHPRVLPSHSGIQSALQSSALPAVPHSGYNQSKHNTARSLPSSRIRHRLAVPFGVGNEGCGQLQNILFAVNIREGIIMHRLSEIDSIENPDTVSVLQKGLAAVDYDIAFRVSDHIGTVAL